MKQQHLLSRQDTITNRWKSAFSVLKNNRKKINGSYNNNNNNLPQHRFQERPTSIGSAHQFSRFDQDFVCYACGLDVDQKSSDENINLICVKCDIRIHGSCSTHPHSALCLDHADQYVNSTEEAAASPITHRSIIINDVDNERHFFSIKEGYRIHKSQNDLLSPILDQSSVVEEQKLCIDPVYLALKRGNQMSISRRRQLSPTTPNNDSGVKSTSPVMSPAVSQGTLSTFKPSEDARPDSKSIVKPAASQQAPPSSTYSSTVTPKYSPLSKGVCKAPKLNSKMKSLSLDCSEFSKIHSRLAGNSSVNSSPTPNRRSIRVPPCEGVDAENDMLLSNVMRCTSRCKPLSVVPNSQFAVVHNNRAKYTGECELRAGDRVTVTDMKDRDWWQGCNVDGNTGIFPATCVAHIHKNERIMQLLQNVNLVDGMRNLRLYRDQVRENQIVFASIDKPVINGFVVIRTEHNRVINCPLNCLTSLEQL